MDLMDCAVVVVVDLIEPVMDLVVVMVIAGASAGTEAVVFVLDDEVVDLAEGVKMALSLLGDDSRMADLSVDLHKCWFLSVLLCLDDGTNA